MNLYLMLIFVLFAWQVCSNLCLWMLKGKVEDQAFEINGLQVDNRLLFEYVKKEIINKMGEK